MAKVLETCHGNQPDDARDECVWLLLALGAEDLTNTSVVKRVIRESCALRGVPRIINEAIVGLVAARKRPRDGAPAAAAAASSNLTCHRKCSTGPNSNGQSSYRSTIV
ncbi:hypothetical protein FOA52_014619 [Chlamydomonas sp. UWO 241]|nr:hypothetical protein FOA52_014619 [Chlamydomonas sp. UWO 241]